MPFVAAADISSFPAASLLVSALFAAACLLLLEGILRKWGVGRSRYLMTAAMLAHPRFLESCFDGSSVTTVIFLVTLTAFSLVQWTEERKMRHLIYFGLGNGFLAAMNFEMLAWLAAVLVLFVADLLPAKLERRQKEAAIILVLIPPLYTVGLWMLMNRLIMGDALYFLKSLYAAWDRREFFETAQAAVSLNDWLATAVCALVIVLAVFQRRRSGAWLGVLGMFPVVMAVFMISRGIL